MWKPKVLALLTYSKVEHDGNKKLMLMFEKATQGDVWSFLDRQFRTNLNRIDRWRLFCGAVYGISSGLAWMHSHNIVHRSVMGFMSNVPSSGLSELRG